MKKASFLVMAFFFAVLCNFSASAQVEYTWEDYNLKFSVPSDFKESASDGEHFEGSSDRGKIYYLVCIQSKTKKLPMIT